MGKVTPLKIDVNDGRLPLKDKGLDMKDFSSVAELRRDCLLYTSPSPRDRG